MSPARATTVPPGAVAFSACRTGKWIHARYRATTDEVSVRYAEWEITGAAEVRGDEPVKMFNPALPMLVHGLRPDDPPDMQPAIDACERFLVRLFLRRYATWCARSGHLDRVPGAAALYRRLANGEG